MNKYDYYLYGHGGSGNHGCEAIVRTTANMLNSKALLFSFKADEDYLYGVNNIVDISKYGKNIKKNNVLVYYFAAIWKKIFRKSEIFNKLLIYYIQKEGKKCKVALSVGGDNYCYGIPKWLIKINKYFNRNKVKTVLWGCSIEPELLVNASVRNDLNQYSLIVTRESLTYNALLDAGIKARTCLIPDPAFSLSYDPKVEFDEDGDWVGINYSMYALNTAKDQDLAMGNICCLMDYILKNTNMNIMLIPHVVWEGKNDLDILQSLYEKFAQSDRIIVLSDMNCEQIKAYIRKCRFFVGARTHSTIAAYSSMVPTLVVGYSVKAKGIAQDIFGTYEGYVIDASELETKEDLKNAFMWIEKNEISIKEHLASFMPQYCAKVFNAKKELEKVIGE